MICHRPRKPVDERRLVELAERGLGTTVIGKALGVSPKTVQRRLAELGYRYDPRERRWVKAEISEV